MPYECHYMGSMEMRPGHIDRPDEQVPRRTKTLQLRVSPQEHSVMMLEARRYGLPVSAWLRLLAQSAIEQGRLRRREPLKNADAPPEQGATVETLRRHVAGNTVES